MRKGEQTRAAIVEAALEIASTQGLEGLTIGSIAEKMAMSKSGVFAHFGSREELQIAVLKEYETQFINAVLFPCLKEPRGFPRLRAIFMRWLDRIGKEIDSGCIYISGATEYDDRPGAVRDVLVNMHRDWQKEMRRAASQAIEENHLPAGSADADQLVFDMVGIILAAHQQGRLMGDTQCLQRARHAFDRMMAQYQNKPSNTSSVILT
ncbi:MAG TPA: TetR/AcrR family transcriptional regulator [Limnobacter sp.]|uniref:TetR/AcrR family transcriptional regulator n=1 Tax=Limnobacter sp. TaxID=2003368 RepID=UPI002EDA8DB8